MTSLLLSTNEVSTLLKVTESTVKRWADANQLPCTRTVGGHRKFALNDLLKFAEEHALPLTATPPSLLDKNQKKKLETGVLTRDYQLIGEVFLVEALQANRKTLLAILDYLAKHQIPFPLMLDEIIRPTLVAIGLWWQEGKVTVDQEHRTTQAIRESMIQLIPDLLVKQKNGLHAVCAAPEDEEHDVGLRGVASSLELEGWDVDYIGPKTPLDVLQSYILSTRPELICISITNTMHTGKRIAQLDRVASAARYVSAKLVVGGQATESLPGIHADLIGRSAQDLLRYVRDAFGSKPGPKPRSRNS